MATLDPSVPASPGNPTAPLNPMDTVASGNPTGIVTINPNDRITGDVQYYRTGNTGTVYQNSAYKAPSVSTTTISNANKIQQVPGIINTTNQLSQTGISTNAAGQPVYANGTIVPTPTTAAAPNPNPTPNANTTATGGYVGDVYYAPGATLPSGPDGKPMATTITSPTDDQIMANINAQIAANDAITASLIQSIQAQYTQLRQQQERANKSQEAGVNNALLMGGVTGSGSSAQYAPISSAGIVQSQVSYGIQKIADLNAKEQSAIMEAKQAGQANNFRLMDRINAEIGRIRDDKVAEARKLSDKIATQNEKMREERLQADKDNAIANLYSSGVTDPKEILKQLNDMGMTVNSKEVYNTLEAIDTTEKETQVIDNILNSVISAMTSDDKANNELIQSIAKEYGVRPEFLKNRVKGVEQQQVAELMNKYVDAGITLADTLAMATSKLKNSKIYQKQVRPPRGPTPSGTKIAASALGLAQEELSKDEYYGEDGYIDPGIYQDLRTDFAVAIGNPARFDDVFASLLSPQERARLGIGKASGVQAIEEDTDDNPFN